MITNYYRPQNLDEVLKLLSITNNRPLGGGTWLNRPGDEEFSVVDLQSLGFNKILKVGNTLEVGACTTLQQLLESLHCPGALKQAIPQESALNIRNMATLAGTLVASDGRSPIATTLLAMDAKLTMITEQSSTINGLGEFLPVRPRGLITEISIPLNVKSYFAMVARSPKDKPIVCVALSQWSGGRTRLALGGYGKCSQLAMDGTESDGIESAARNAFYEAGDEWVTAEYRVAVAATLAKRCLDAISPS